MALKTATMTSSIGPGSKSIGLTAYRTPNIIITIAVIKELIGLSAI